MPRKGEGTESNLTLTEEAEQKWRDCPLHGHACNISARLLFVFSGDALIIVTPSIEQYNTRGSPLIMKACWQSWSGPLELPKRAHAT